MQPVTPITQNQPKKDLAELVHAYNQAKQRLDDAKNLFLAIEAELTEEVGHKEEGSFSCYIDGFKVTTVGRVTRKLDEKQWAKIAPEVGERLANRLVKTKYDINLRELRYIENNEPEVFKQVATAITSKPSKPSIKVEAEV